MSAIDKQPRGYVKERNAALAKPQVTRKRVFVNGRSTSISIEKPFFDALKEIAAAENLDLNALVTNINTNREYANLSSAVRLFVLNYYQERAKQNSDVPDA